MDSLIERVWKANLELVKRGLVLYTWGNVSAVDRERGIVVIKPSGVDYNGMTADDMVTVDLQGNPVAGHYKPSVDLDIHLELYRRFPGVGGVAHTHSAYATAWAQAGASIPVLGTTHADEFYGLIPCTREMTAAEILEGNYEENTGKVIAELFTGRDPMRVFCALQKGHGPFTWGATPEAAVENSVILEEVARMASVTMGLNPNARPIPQALQDKHFFRKHGAAAYFYQDQK